MGQSPCHTAVPAPPQHAARDPVLCMGKPGNYDPQPESLYSLMQGESKFFFLKPGMPGSVTHTASTIVPGAKPQEVPETTLRKE